MEYNRAINYEDMLDRELSRRYNWLNANNQLFNTTGKITQENDLRNWAIQNQNLDRQYANDIQDYNNSFGHQLGKIGTMVGAGIGTMINPALGMAIYGAGNALNSDAQNMLGGANGGINLGFDYDDIYNIAEGVGARYGMPYWSTKGGLEGDQIANGSNPWHFNWGNSDSVMDSLRNSNFYQRLFGGRG